MSDDEDGSGGAVSKEDTAAARKPEIGCDAGVASAINSRALEILAAASNNDDVRLQPTVQDVDRGVALNQQLRHQLIDYQSRFEEDDMVSLATGLQMSSFVNEAIEGVFNWCAPQRDLPSIDGDAIELLTQVGLGFMLDRMRAGEIASRARGSRILTRSDIVTGDVLRGDLDEDEGDAMKARYEMCDRERAARLTPGVDLERLLKNDIYSQMKEERHPCVLVVKYANYDNDAGKEVVAKEKYAEEETLVKNCSFVSDSPIGT